MLVRLADLDASNTLVDDDALAYLKRLLPARVSLNLYTTNVTDAGLGALGSMTHALTWLNLDNTKVTDAGLPKLKRLVNLEFLHLGRTGISDAGVDDLTGLRKLKTLHVTGRTAVTESGAEKLRRALPDCEVLSGGAGRVTANDLPEVGIWAAQCRGLTTLDPPPATSALLGGVRRPKSSVGIFGVLSPRTSKEHSALAETSRLKALFLRHFSKPAYDRLVYQAIARSRVRSILELGWAPACGRGG